MYAEICTPVQLEKMAWTYRSRRYSSRTVRRSFRRRRMARPRYRPRYRRSRRSRKTASPVVKLTSEITWDNFAQQSGQARRYSPFYFAPTVLPGFPDYQLTYSQFRILKCRLQLSLGSEGGEVDNFLVAPSRPFARNMGPSNLGDNRTEVFVPVAEETALRQTRWQKVIYPNKITRKLSIGFKPYTLVATLGPSSMRNSQWSRTWECNRWMPFNWANTSQYDLNPDGNTAALFMYGPYLVPNAPTGADASVNSKIYGTLTVYLQFRGQR